MIPKSRRSHTWFLFSLVPTLCLTGCGKDEGFDLERKIVGSMGGATGAPGGAGGGQGGSTTAGGGSVSQGPSELGTACTNSNSCASGLSCLASSGADWLGGGPPGGLCTATCDFDLDCEPFDLDGVCLDNGFGQGYCFPSCTMGSTQALGEVKCQDRNTLACTQLSLNNVCQPTCGSDLDCAGRICDLALGVCVDSIPGQNKGMGAKCDPNAAERECEGECIELAADYFICTGICNFGVAGCGLGPADPVEPGAPICLPLSQGGGEGDAGFCIQRCDCDDDCLHPDSLCSEFSDEATKTAISAQGLCLPNSLTESDGSPLRGLACEGGTTPDDGGTQAPDGG